MPFGSNVVHLLCIFTLDWPSYCDAIVPLPTAIDSGVAMMPKEAFVVPAEGAVSYINRRTKKKEFF